jgi:hypothetical protein
LNTTVKFSNITQCITVASADFKWLNTPSAINTGGSIPTVLFGSSGAYPTSALISGVDLSALGSLKYLVTPGTSTTAAIRYYFQNCKLNAALAGVINGTIPAPGGVEVYLDNCGNTNYQMAHYKYQGSIVNENTVVRTGGASDGTTQLSWNMTSLATGPSLIFPLESPIIAQWNDSPGSHTATVEFVSDYTLTNENIWLELEYLGTSGYPESILVNNAPATAPSVPSATAWPASAASWGGSQTTPQNMSVSFTTTAKGLVRAKVKLAKTGATVYVDPVLTIV